MSLCIICNKEPIKRNDAVTCKSEKCQKLQKRKTNTLYYRNRKKADPEWNEKLKVYKKNWTIQNKSRVQAREKAWYLKNREKILASQKRSRKRINERNRERYRRDPEHRELKNNQRRERRKDPEYREKMNKHQREYMRERMKDPAIRAKYNKRQRERRRERREAPAIEIELKPYAYEAPRSSFLQKPQMDWDSIPKGLIKKYPQGHKLESLSEKPGFKSFVRK